MQTQEYLKHLNQTKFEQVVKNEIIFEFLIDDLQTLCDAKGYTVTSWGDWYRYGVEQTLNQTKFYEIDYTNRKQGLRMLVLLVYSNMRKWFAKNDHDATRVKQRSSYEHFIQNMHDTITISIAKIIHFLRELKSKSLTFRKKIREKVYHFFKGKPLKIDKWCKFLGFKVYKKRQKPIKKSQQFSSVFYEIYKQKPLQSKLRAGIKKHIHASTNSFNHSFFSVAMPTHTYNSKGHHSKNSYHTNSSYYLDCCHDFSPFKLFINKSILFLFNKIVFMIKNAKINPNKIDTELNIIAPSIKFLSPINNLYSNVKIPLKTVIRTIKRCLLSSLNVTISSLMLSVVSILSFNSIGQLYPKRLNNG